VLAAQPQRACAKSVSEPEAERGGAPSRSFGNGRNAEKAPTTLRAAGKSDTHCLQERMTSELYSEVAGEAARILYQHHANTLSLAVG
jgi:NCAIR mutase (PurE)-related protein